MSKKAKKLKNLPQLSLNNNKLNIIFPRIKIKINQKISKIKKIVKIIYKIINITKINSSKRLKRKLQLLKKTKKYVIHLNRQKKKACKKNKIHS